MGMETLDIFGGRGELGLPRGVTPADNASGLYRSLPSLIPTYPEPGRVSMMFELDV